MRADLPVEELFCYNGINPKPDDFDDYWDAALAELDSVPPDPVKKPASFSCKNVEGYDLWFNGTRGAKLHARYVTPSPGGKDDEKKPCVFCFHGYTGRAPDWVELLPWAVAGFSVAALDCRGQGGLSDDPSPVEGTTLRGHIIRGLDDKPENLVFRHVFLDTVQIVRAVATFPETDVNRMGSYGGSQGGALSLVCAALDNRIKLAAPIYPFLCDYRRVWDMCLGTTAYGELRDFFRKHDPRHEREEEIFTRLGYIDIQFLAPRIKAEVLMQTGLEDDTCPPSSQFAVYNKIVSPKKVLIYPDFTHENMPESYDIVFGFLSKL